MKLSRLFRLYRCWLVLPVLMLASSLCMLSVRINQLATEDTHDLGLMSGVIRDLRAPHLRSVRNYEQRPPDSFKILKVLQDYSGHNMGSVSQSGKMEIEKSRDNGSILNSPGRDKASGSVPENKDVLNGISRDTNSDENPNPGFKPGDFSDIMLQQPTFKYNEFKHQAAKQPSVKTKLQHKNVKVMQMPRKSGKTVKNFRDIHVGVKNKGKLSNEVPRPYTEGVFWTNATADTVPTGKSDAETVSLLNYVRSQPVKSLQPPDWYRCGRPLNGIVTLQDGRVMCARYRTPHNKLILGEVTSFHLSRLLGLDNVPPVVITWVNGSQPQWAGANFTRLHWQPNQAVALIDWVPDLDNAGSRVMIPPRIHTALVTKTPVTTSVLAGQRLSRAELSQLVQWGDLILFDYLTANYDRYLSMQDGADREKKPSILLERVRNLRQSSITGKFWLIDNEGGLFDAYEQLYFERKQRFRRFHLEMLQTMCVFRRDLVTRIEKLATNMNPHKVLQEFTRASDRLVDCIKYDRSAVGYTLFREHFKDRLQEVVRWVKHCASLSSA